MLDPASVLRSRLARDSNLRFRAQHTASSLAQRPVPTQRGARAYSWLMHDGRKTLGSSARHSISASVQHRHRRQERTHAAPAALQLRAEMLERPCHCHDKPARSDAQRAMQRHRQGRLNCLSLSVRCPISGSYTTGPARRRRLHTAELGSGRTAHAKAMSHINARRGNRWTIHAS